MDFLFTRMKLEGISQISQVLLQSKAKYFKNHTVVQESDLGWIHSLIECYLCEFSLSFQINDEEVRPHICPVWYY